MDKKELIKIAKYFYRNNIQILPITPNHKYPAYIKEWQNFSFKNEQEIEEYINKGYGLGIKPNMDFCYFDLDSDHGEYDGVENFKQVVPHVDSICAVKPDSKNVHIFYQSPDFRFRLTGNEAITQGVECSNSDSFIRIEPAYHFVNLDFNKPFISQLASMSEFLEELIKVSLPIKRPYETKKNRTHHISNYLAKISPFEVGSRSESYRKLVYTMCIKNDMPYDEVREAIIKWDSKNINFQDSEPSQFFHAIREPK